MSDLLASYVNQSITKNNTVNSIQKPNQHPNTGSSLPRQLDYPSDSAQFNGQEVRAQKKLSKGAKWSIGTAAAIVGSVVVYFLTRGKVGSKQVQQLAEHIDFKEAKTLEEAIEFGKKHLGIKKYKGFEEKDLKVINFVNEGLVNASNKMKGKFNTAREIHYVNGESDFFASVDLHGKILTINKGIYGDIDNAIKNYSSYVTLDIKTKRCTVPAMYGLKSQEMKDILGQLNKFYENKLDYREKVRLLTNLEHITEEVEAFHLNPLNKIQKMLENQVSHERILKLGLESDIDKISKLTTEEQAKLLDEYMEKCNIRFKYKPVSEFRPIYHESGHINDPNLLKRANRAELYNNDVTKYPKELKEWLDNENNTKVASLITYYATECPAEFLAETFAEFVESKKIPNEVIALCKHYKGPILG